ncbi:MAG: HAMP domain-containing sensor histidine kinase [archaeon]
MDVYLLVTAFHGINRFLDSSAGELFKQSLEFVLFSIVAYMVYVEYRRERTVQLRYFLWGFSALVIDNFCSTLFLALVVFGNVPANVFMPYFPVADLVLESLALLALAYSFVMSRIRGKHVQRMLSIELVAILFVGGLVQVLWLITLQQGTVAFSQSMGFFLLELIQLVILFIPIYVLLTSKKEKYARSIALAFGVYMFAPALSILNFVFCEGANAALKIIVHPLPFLSVLLFTRVMYLKLGDKASLQQELQLAKKKYLEEREVVRMKDEFVSTVTHELKTPLTSMKLYLALLREQKTGTLNKEQKKMLRIVEEENTRLSQLITDVLHLSKLEGGNEQLHLVRTSIRHVVENSMYYNLAEERGIRITITVDTGLMADVDPEKFKQIFINLFSNAVKYAKSVIIIDAANTPHGWYFSISDDGPGIPPEKIPHLFERFFRVEDYLTTDKAGTGLGLAIVKKLAELHGAKIDVDTHPGKGTTFKLFFPKKEKRYAHDSHPTIFTQ